MGYQRKKINLAGQTIHHLRVIKDSGNRENGSVVWQCTCLLCGNNKLVSARDLVQDKIKSCGCKKRERIAKGNPVHGLCYTPEYRAWKNMKQRCYNTRVTGYHNYGGRGIQVCKRWMNSFESFYKDMGPRPSDGYSIDRVNNDGDYKPSNCRWATRSQQNLNTRRSTAKRGRKNVSCS